MSTGTDADLLTSHLQGALGAAQEVQKRLDVLRGELYVAQKRAEAAEQSRDIIRSHAQANLERYRLEQRLLWDLEAEVKNILHTLLSSKDCNLLDVLMAAKKAEKTLEDGRARLFGGNNYQLLPTSPVTNITTKEE